MSASKRPMQLLELPDELLSEVLQHISVADKQQRVQRSCIRLRRLLKQPTGRRTWGSIGVRLVPEQTHTTAKLQSLLQWLVALQAGGLRKCAGLATGSGSRSPHTTSEHWPPHAGVTEVRLGVGDWTGIELEPALGAQAVLHALAGALAPTQTPLLLTHPQNVDIERIPAFTLNALAATLQPVTLVSPDFRPQHWAPLCSLRSLRELHLALLLEEPPPAQQPPFVVQSMQLTKLQKLLFVGTGVEITPLIAPLMAQASALTALKMLHFQECGLSTLPAGVSNLPQLLVLYFINCKLARLPPLAPLTELLDLKLRGNPALTDLRPVLAGKHQLRRLVLQDSVPLTVATLEALRGLRRLKVLDISQRSWTWADAAVLGHLVQLTHEKGCKLIT